MFAHVLVFCSLAPAQILVPPEFCDGELAALTCKVTAVREIHAGAQLLTVEVSNGGPKAAEPLSFTIELRDKSAQQKRTEQFARVQLPMVARFGRPTPAGGKQTYTLTTSLPGKKPQYAVSVAAASWSSDGGLAKCDLTVGKPEQVLRTSLAGEFPITQVELRNPYPCDVDVLMLVKLRQPHDMTVLLGARVLAASTLPWIVWTWNGSRSYVGLEALPGCAMKATEFDVVDWSFVGADRVDAAAELLRPAYESWYRWPEAASVTGRFTFRERRQRLNSTTEYDDFVVSGRFALPADGEPTTTIESGSGADPKGELAVAFDDLRRPDFTTFMARNQVARVATNRVEYSGPGWLSQRRSSQLSTSGSAVGRGVHEDLEVAGSSVVSDGWGDGARTRWQMQDLGLGRVVTRRQSESQVFSCSYVPCEGRLVPNAVTNTTQFGDKLFMANELVLSDVTFASVAKTAVPPAGSGVEALRAAWAATWQIPATPLELTASFEVTTPGTDFLWCGRKKVTGELTMTGLGRHLRALQFDFPGEVSPDIEMRLASAFRDRLGMWHPRDVNDRAPFDECFAGAVIHGPDTSGRFRIEGSPFEAVSTTAGVIKGWHRRDSGKWRFSYSQVGGTQVATRLQYEAAEKPLTVVTSWAKVGEHIVPTSWRIEYNFGPDWGPETIVLKNVKVR